MALCLGSASSWLSTAPQRCQEGQYVTKKQGPAFVVVSARRGSELAPKDPYRATVAICEAGHFSITCVPRQGAAPLEGVGIRVGLGAQTRVFLTWWPERDKGCLHAGPRGFLAPHTPVHALCCSAPPVSSKASLFPSKQGLGIMHILSGRRIARRLISHIAFAPFSF